MTEINTLRDILNLVPDGFRCEIIDNVLYVQPGPGLCPPQHEQTIGALVAELRPRYQKGTTGPGGWYIQTRPGVTLPAHLVGVKVPLGIEKDSFQPDVAGWRGHTVGSLSFTTANETAVCPDWVCEVLSTNRAYDWGTKKPAYEKLGVRYLWMVDPDERSLEAFERVNGAYRSIAKGTGSVVLQGVEPFPGWDVVLTDLWS